MTPSRLIVIGASSGGIEALRTIVAGLPSDFSTPICVVIHTSADAPGVLDRILTRAGALTAITATTGMRLRAGQIYVAPPDYHLLVEPGRLLVTKGPKENRFRPAVDPLFRSAAQIYGANAIGVILTGNLDDGTAGLWAIKQLGGTAVVQDPKEALFPSMPASALRYVDADFTVTLPEMAPLLQRLVSEPARGDSGSAPPVLEVEVKIARGENAVAAGVEQIGEASRFACPECHGVLLHIRESRPMSFRCHTGHAYSASSLVAAINEGIEDALWTAIRALEEGALLMNHLSQPHPGRPLDNQRASEAFAELSADAHRQSEAVRQVVHQRTTLRMPDEQ